MHAQKPYAVGTFGAHDFEIIGHVEGATATSLARVFGVTRFRSGDTLSKTIVETPIPGALERAREFAAAPQLKLSLRKILDDYRRLAGHDDRLVEEAELTLAFAEGGVEVFG